MKNVNKYGANPSQKKNKNGNTVDPKEFQKSVHKAEKTDESEQRKKKNRQAMIEEDFDLDDSHPTVNVPEGLFKQLMQTDEKNATIYDAEEGSSPNLIPENDIEEEISPSYIPEYQEGQTSKVNINSSNLNKPSLGEEDFYSDEHLDLPPSETQKPTPQPFPTYSENAQNNIENKSQPFTENYFSSPHPSPEKKEPSKSSQTNSSKKTKKQETKKKETKKKEPKKKHGEKSSQTTPDPTTKKPKQVSDQEKEISFSSPKDDDDGKKQLKTKNGKKTTSVTEKGTKEKVPDGKNIDENLSDQNLKDQDTSSDQQNNEDVVAPETISPMSSTNIEALQLSPFANIPKDVFELFQKMVGLMIIEKENGKSTTTVTLNLPNSIFDKGELVLDHYDTAPHAYNVQFLGSPEAIDKFAASMQELNNAITEAKLTFSIHLLSPKLSKNYAGKIESSDERSDQQKKDGGKKQK